MFYSYTCDTSYELTPFLAWLFSMALIVLAYASLWRIFKKAGKPGWAIFVPIYNSYVMSQITYGNGLLCILLYIPVVNFIFSVMQIIKLAEVFNRSQLFGLGVLFFPFVFLPILAFNSDSYYSGPAVTSGSYITAGRTPSNYGQNYYNQMNNNPYSTDTYYGQSNDGFYGQNNGYGNNNYGNNNYGNSGCNSNYGYNGYDAQTDSDNSKDDYFYGRSDDSSDSDYNQDNNTL